MNTAVNSLGHIDNVVPSDLKRTFNFKGRKAIDIAARLIKRLTLDNDIVLDPVGSGSFVLACALINRRIIGCELDNYTYDALRILLEKYNQDLFKKLYTQVKEDCFENIMRLYITECFGIKNYIDKNEIILYNIISDNLIFCQQFTGMSPSR